MQVVVVVDNLTHHQTLQAVVAVVRVDCLLGLLRLRLVQHIRLLLGQVVLGQQMDQTVLLLG